MRFIAFILLSLAFTSCSLRIDSLEAERIASQIAEDRFKVLGLSSAEFVMTPPKGKSASGFWVFTWQHRIRPETMIHVAISEWGDTDWQISDTLRERYNQLKKNQVQ